MSFIEISPWNNNYCILRYLLKNLIHKLQKGATWTQTHYLRTLEHNTVAERIAMCLMEYLNLILLKRVLITNNCGGQIQHTQKWATILTFKETVADPFILFAGVAPCSDL